MTTFDEADCLKTNPFEGDFGSPGDKVLKDKIGTARKGGTCGMCRQEIAPGERVRLLAAVFDGQLMSYRWCSECCAAMAASRTDDGRAWEARVRIGDESSNALAQADAACGVSPGATGSAAHYGGRTMATRKIEEIWPGLQPMAKKAQLIAETQGRPAYVALNPTGDVSADFPGVDCHRVHANGDVDCCVCAP